MKRETEAADWFILLMAVYIAWLPTALDMRETTPKQIEQNPNTISNVEGKTQ